MRQNPFSLYDFLGYFTPGAIFIFGLAFLWWIRLLPVSLASLCESFAGIGQPELILPFILFSYLLGHMLSFFSSITVERYSIWQVGYPSGYLLGKPKPGYFAITENPWTRRVFRVFTFVLLLPLSVWERVLHFIGADELYAKKLTPILRAMINQKTIDMMKTHFDYENLKQREKKEKENECTDELRERDLFRAVYHFVLERSSAHGLKMQNFVGLYGFSRTVSLIFVTFSWVAVGFFLCGVYAWPLAAVVFGVSSVVSILFYLSFNKFYRKFSVEALMALVSILEKEPTA